MRNPFEVLRTIYRKSSANIVKLSNPLKWDTALQKLPEKEQKRVKEFVNFAFLFLGLTFVFVFQDPLKVAMFTPRHEEMHILSLISIKGKCLRYLYLSFFPVMFIGLIISAYSVVDNYCEYRWMKLIDIGKFAVANWPNLLVIFILDFLMIVWPLIYLNSEPIESSFSDFNNIGYQISNSDYIFLNYTLFLSLLILGITWKIIGMFHKEGVNNLK